MVLHFTPPSSGTSNRIKISDIELPLVKNIFLKLIYHRARRYQLHREAISSLYTYGYGLHRSLLLELGQQFKRRFLLEDKEDIFFLYYDEVREVVAGNQPELDLKELVKQRQGQIDKYKEIIPPDTIFGDQAPALETQQDSSGLKGVPTSRGLFTGSVRVMSGLQDMTKIKSGDILVVPYSDVGWTPLFAKAGAIIAESGGILSHCSIVAREYGIPAVVSVSGACQLADGTQVTVDGHSGKITVHESE
jgi:pyruvate,water dikinase